ncbi:hypothetical protein OROHE_005988 [Orobanche hederae]
MPSREILKIRDGTPLEMPSQEISKIRVGTPLELDMPSREILKIRDGTPLEAISRNFKNSCWYPFGGRGNFDIHKKSPQNESFCYFSSKLDVPSNVVRKKRVARILFSKIRPSREILKIRDGTPLEKKRVARILFSKISPSREILIIRDGTPLEAEEILTYIKKLSKRIEPSREILKIRDGTPLEAEEILTYIKKPSKRIVAISRNFKNSCWYPFGGRGNFDIHKKSPQNESFCYFSSKLDVPSNVVRKKRVARILFSKIRPSREILKIRDGTPLEAEEILTYIKKLSKWIGFPSREILIIRDGTPLEMPSREILKIRDGTPLELDVQILIIRDGTPLEAEEILTYIKKLSKRIEILKIRDGTPLEKKRVAGILFSKIRPFREILKMRDGTPFGGGGNFDIHKKALETDRPSREIFKIRDGTPFGGGGNFDIHKKLSKRIDKKRVAGILFSKIRPSREILKMRDGTPFGGGGNFDIHKKALETDRKEWHGFCFPKLGHLEKFSKFVMVPHLEAEEILTYIKSSRNGSVCYFSSKLDVPSNVVRNKRVARILFSKIRPSREILKIRDGTPLEAEEILTYIKKPTKWIEILKIRDGTPLEMPSREILKIRDGTPLEKKRVAGILFSKIRPSREILKMRDGTPFGGGGNFDIHKKALETDRPSREIFKIRDGTPLEKF